MPIIFQNLRVQSLFFNHRGNDCGLTTPDEKRFTIRKIITDDK